MLNEDWAKSLFTESFLWFKDYWIVTFLFFFENEVSELLRSKDSLDSESLSTIFENFNGFSFPKEELKKFLVELGKEFAYGIICSCYFGTVFRGFIGKTGVLI